jgi:hypothetical protein
MSRVHKIILLVLLATFAAVATPGQGRPDAIDQAEMHKTVFFAVLEGLYRDGVSNDAVDAILRKTEKGYVHFVYGCPLCVPTLDALLVYRARAKFSPKKALYGDTLGAGLPEASVRRLHSEVPKERLDVIHGLIGKWVGSRLRLMRLDKDERQAWTILLEEGRKRGMSLVGADPSFVGSERCAVCDGANDAWEK